MMLPVIDALTSSMWPLRSATVAMINSAALPKVAFRNPPHAGPTRRASCSVPTPIRPASGINDTAAVMNTHGDPCAVSASSHEIGATTSRTFIGDEVMARSMWGRLQAERRVRCRLVSEFLDILVFGARQQVEEGVEAAIERSAKLRNRSIEGVQRQARRGPVGQLQRTFLDPLQRAFGDQPDAVDQCVSRHLRIVLGSGLGAQNLPRGGDRIVEVGDLTVHLLLVHRFQNVSDAWPRLEAEREQMAAEQDRLRWTMLNAERAGAFEEPVHRRAVERARPPPLAIGFRHARQQFEIHLVREAPKRAVADFVAHLEPGSRLEVLRRDPEYLPANVVAFEGVDVEAIEQRGGRRDTLLLVIEGTDAAVEEH